jgi:uncharacterized repeat protein (TIGR01451 family)
LHFMRLFKFFTAWSLTEPLTRMSRQRSAVLLANLRLAALSAFARTLKRIDESVTLAVAKAVGSYCATGAKKVTVKTKKLTIVGFLLGLFMGSAAAAPVFQAAGTAVGSSSDVTVTWPVHAIGDVALLFVESTGYEAAVLDTPNGFAPVLNSPQSSNGSTRITVFWARATSAAMADPVLKDPGNHSYSQIITYRGVINTGNPWDVTGGGTKTTASTSVTVAGVTTTVPDTLIVQVVSRDNDSAAPAFSAQTNGNLTAIAERSDAGTTQGNGGGFAVWDGVLATAGATGTTSADVTASQNAFLTIALKPPGATLGGRVFEDANYGGGAGRSLAASSGVAVLSARVELFDSGGTFVTSTLTNASGDYSFSGLAAGDYTVRVVNNTVRSTRTGGGVCGTACLPVQTWRTSAASGVAVAVPDRVGGEIPQLTDAGNGSTSLAALTTGTTTAQSITVATLSGSNITGLDFGFNFDTIVSTRDTGQGSLRQFIVNSNALGGEGGLAQSGLTLGAETSVFMIPNGQANPGHNTGYANQLATTGANAGAAVITLATALPAISGTSTRLDATTQTANVRATPGGGETNSGTVGTGGTVGVSAVTLAAFGRPEVVIYLNNTQINATADYVVFKGFAAEYGGLQVQGSNSQVLDTFVGMRADGTVATIYGATYGLIAGAGTNILLSHNYVKVNNSGIRGDSPGANLVVEFNEVDSPLGTPGGGHTNTFDGILIVNSATNVLVRYNLSKNQRGGGLEFGFGTGSMTGTATDNTILTNGFVSAGVSSTEPMGITAYDLAAGTALTLSFNIVSNNAGPGFSVINASGIGIRQNSTFANGGLGIDLDPRNIDPNLSGAPQGVTLNDVNDSDTGPNGLLNYPVLTTASISGTNLTVTGFARPDSVIELFIAAPDPSGFGEGQTYKTTLTEGSAADTDATTGTYGPGAINGILQGTDTTNRFSFTISIPGGVAIGTVLTATATLSGNTSEFSGNVIVTGAPSLVFMKTVSVASDPVNLTSNPKNIPGAFIEYTLRVTNTGAGTVTANSIVIVDPIPANTELFVNSLGASPANSPIAFASSVTPPSGVTFAFTSLNNTPVADDIEFSNQAPVAGVYTFGYLPTPNALGVDPAVTAIRLNPKGTMAGSNGGSNPYFELKFQVRVK